MGRPSKQHYDAIVVGSGFGGSVMAYQLAKAGLSVCLLERGKKYAPGDFARNPYEMRFNFWDPSNGLHGLFNIWSFKGIDAIVASGLGGGSLIYANVLLRKPAATFEGWPIDADELEPHYQAVLKMLEAQHYPAGRAPYNQSLKGVRLIDAAHCLRHKDDRFSTLQVAEHSDLHPWLGVAFAGAGQDPGAPIDDGRPNTHKKQRYTCRLCGECDIGCNSGSKNTLDFNYLADAEFVYGAEIVTRCEMRSFQPVFEAGQPAGYEVTFVDHQHAHAAEQTETHDDAVLAPDCVTARQLILAAGTIGTTYLMLKSAEKLPAMNREALGARFCGNGDLLGFARVPRHSAPQLDSEHLRDHSFGPVITTALYQPGGGADGAQAGFYIEDAGYPIFLSWLFHLGPLSLLRRWREVLLRLGLLASLALRYINSGITTAEEARREQQKHAALQLTAWQWLRHNLRRRVNRGWSWCFQQFIRLLTAGAGYQPTWPDLSDEFSQLLGIFEGRGEVIPLLAVGQDVADGQMYLAEETIRKQTRHDLQIKWSKEGKSKQYYDHVEATMRQLAQEMGGTFQRNPIERFSRAITVHPLGGCPMDSAIDGARRPGVVDRNGEVHGYKGLFIADGSVMPGPVVANPALTIAALARHFSTQVIQNHHAALLRSLLAQDYGDQNGHELRAPYPTVGTRSAR